ncbi:MAG TPA: SPOR domain-containing protein [Burkholderiaceae bacterium]|nr:SPOR domain-containing protein [Burkholderiaceae bacterium]
MGLLSFLKLKRQDPPARSAAPADVVAQARTKARRRLIGAVVLLGIGIIGFPLLFETQPRPIAVDIPIEIPRKDAAPQLAMPAPRPAPAPATSAAPPAKPEVVTETAEAPKPVPSAPVSAVAAKAEPAPVKEAPAPAAKEAPAPMPKPAAVDEGRFVVQVGAFAEVTAAREARVRVEKLGLKTYTQVVETSNGKRIRVRVGPFASRDQAAQAADKLKAAGLPTAVLTL